MARAARLVHMPFDGQSEKGGCCLGSLEDFRHCAGAAQASHQSVHIYGTPVGAVKLREETFWAEPIRAKRVHASECMSAWLVIKAARSFLMLACLHSS